MTWQNKRYEPMIIIIFSSVVIFFFIGYGLGLEVGRVREANKRRGIEDKNFWDAYHKLVNKKQKG